MVVTTNNPMTIKRMTAIANITGNITIATSKALLIDEAIRQMQNGVCHFVFQKKDGTITERFGTLNPALCSQHIKGTGKSPELRGCTLFWDVVSGGFRSFLWQNFIAILQSKIPLLLKTYFAFF